MGNSKSLTIPEQRLDLDDVEIIESVLTARNEIIIHVKSTEIEIPCFNEIPKKLPKIITAVCCDMYDGYSNAAKEVFGDSI